MNNVEKRNRHIKNTVLYMLLLVYGGVAAYFIIKNTVVATPLYGEPLSSFYMWLRIDWLNLFIEELKSTGLYTGLHRLFDQNATMYLYLSHLGKMLGTDAVYTFYYTQLALVCVCAAVYPVIFYRISHSLPVALLSILFFRLYAPYSLYLMNDSYYIYAWMTFISLPVLFFLFRDKWNNRNYIWVALLLGVMSVSNIFRSSVGLAIAASLIVLMLIKIIVPSVKEKNYGTMALGLLVCFLAVAGQSFFTSTIPHAYQSMTDQPRVLPIKGPWHTLYVGLGWEENPLGLEYLDGCGYAGREHLLNDPGEGYYICVESPEYMEEMKSVYFDAVFSDVGFFFTSYIRKGFTSLKTVMENTIANITILSNGWFYPTRFTQIFSLITPLTFVYFLYINWKADRKKVMIWLCSAGFIALVNMAFGVLPGIIANPFVREYTFGVTATVDCLVMAEYIVFVYVAVQFVKNIFQKKRTIIDETVKI